MSGPGNNAAENPHAGKGSSVLLDIGGDIGALVIDMPADLADEEVELRKAGSPVPADHGHGHGHGHEVAPHVAVVLRPKPDGTTDRALRGLLRGCPGHL